MLVSELIELLKQQDQGNEVVIAFDYGDYVHTITTEEIDKVEEDLVFWSDGHNRWRMVEPEYRQDYDDTEDRSKTVTLLRG